MYQLVDNEFYMLSIFDDYGRIFDEFVYNKKALTLPGLSDIYR